MQQIIGIVLALVLGFVGGYYYYPTSSGAEDKNAVHVHTHEEREVPAGQPVPEVELVVHEDPAGGYNAQILLTNFRFAPENVSEEHNAGEGHAHIYVDGVKINRVYSEWYHLGKLEPGEHEVLVNLSSNDHHELLSDGEHIEDNEIIIVPESIEGGMAEHMDHDDDDGHMHAEDGSHMHE